MTGTTDTLSTATRVRKPTPPIRCPDCGSTWTGLNKAHCRACCRTFSSPAGFDKHRRDVGGKGACIDPATMKAADDTPYFRLDDAGVWRRAGENPRFADEDEAA